MRKRSLVELERLLAYSSPQDEGYGNLVAAHEAKRREQRRIRFIRWLKLAISLVILAGLLAAWKYRYLFLSQL